MKRLVKNFLIGTSIVVGASTMGAVPTYAASLSGIQFDQADHKTYNYNTITDGDENAAINALTDSDPFTNVELGYSSEFQTENKGFSGMLGGKSVSVETVTADDWNVFGNQWVTDFTTAYSQFTPFTDTIVQNIKQMGAMRFGDPNVGGFTFDENSGEYKLDLIGHHNVLNAPYLQGTQEAMMASLLLGGNPLQMSEVAKVTIDGVVNYAYSFSATETGMLAADAAANDTSSHTGLYSWTLAGEPIQSVPEPSSMLGLMAVSGLVTLSRRKSRNKA
ncbi:MAG: NF038130 family PEP-CTERM protein [Microcoleaceae cyanobacterium]